MLKRVFSFAVFSLVFMACDAMKTNGVCTFYYEGGSFRVTVKKIGTLHSLTETEEKNISDWIEQKPVPLNQKLILGYQIHEFINAPIDDHHNNLCDACDYTYNNFRFRMFAVKREDVVLKVTQSHCQAIATWLHRKSSIRKHTNEKQRLR